jgi:hypothetical protein
VARWGAQAAATVAEEREIRRDEFSMRGTGSWPGLNFVGNFIITKFTTVSRISTAVINTTRRIIDH